VIRAQFHPMKADGRDAWTAADETDVNWYVERYKETMAALKHQHVLDIKRLDSAREELTQKGRIIRQAVVGDVLAEDGTPTPEAKKANTLYAAITAYLETLRTKRVSESHRWRATQVLDSLKSIRPDCPSPSGPSCAPTRNR
jgi:hypothetical protein